jgi:hypothetical protein
MNVMIEKVSNEAITASNTGAVDTSKTVKSGCGIRYDPEVLGEDSGFDFSDAEKLKSIFSDLNKSEN